MGTRLIAAGLALDHDDPALWNLSHPDVVADIHRRDRRAGADVLVTNTFGASRTWLGRYRKAEQLEAINRRAVELAREAVGPDGFVLGDIGPAAAQVSGEVGEQARVLIAAGVDGLLFETFQLDPAEAALRDLEGWSGVPLLVSLFSWPEPIAEAARRLETAGADLLGMNCQAGIGSAVAFAERIRPATALPLFVKPSATFPDRADSEAESFAREIPRLLALGVALLGGCCGTTEVHVAALRSAWYDEAVDPRIASETGTPFSFGR